MAKLNLKATGKNQELVLDYLEKNASDDLAEKINTGTRSIADCWRFITGKAKARATSAGGGSVAMISDDEVYGWAVHFFEESPEDLKKEQSAEDAEAAERRKETDKQRAEENARRLEEQAKEAERKRQEKEAAEKRLAEEAERVRQQKEKEKAEAAARKAAAAEEKRKQKEFDATGAVAGQSSLFDFFSLEE